jgi:hypothetical protein
MGEAQPLERKAEPIESPGREIFEQDVRAAREDLDRAAAILGREVQHDRFLVPIDREVVGRLSGWVEGGTPPAGRVASRRMLDLQDPGPQVPEHHRAVGSGEHAREIEHERAGERRSGDGRHRCRGLRRRRAARVDFGHETGRVRPGRSPPRELRRRTRSF